MGLTVAVRAGDRTDPSRRSLMSILEFRESGSMVASWLRMRTWGSGRRGRVENEGRERSRRRKRPECEGLEGRALLATAGTDYVLSGFAWSNPAHITYSIVPDGTAWDQGTSNLNATFNARFGAAWPREIARAMATWEAVANINIGAVPDSGAPYNAPGLQQGDPRFGDIRIGGSSFPNNTTTLALTNFPYPGSTDAGDTELNTGLGYGIGSGYDLYSVMLHEVGHELGLDEAPNPAEVEYINYHGVLSGLAPGDVAGIQAIYGPRTQDTYQRQGLGLGPSSAIDLTPNLDASQDAAPAAPTSLATIGDTEYFSVVAPTGAGPILQVTADVAGLSLLSPKVSISNASGTPLDVEGDATQWGNNVSAQVGGVTPGQKYIIAVTGATSDVFAVGAYQLHIAFIGGTAAAPTPTPTATPTPVILPPPAATTIAPPTIAPDRFEPNNTPATATRLGTITATAVGSLTINTPTDIDFFTFQAARVGVFQVSAPGTVVRVFDGSGNLLAAGLGQTNVVVTRARKPLFVEILGPNGQTVAGYGLTIGVQVPVRTPKPVLARLRR
jgi:hypothetical protein